ncbi:MAG: hypothetical protein R3F33_12360 [Planctomycetota bacterium]
MLSLIPLAIALVLACPIPSVQQVPGDAAVSLSDDGRGTPYKVDKADNICGLVEPRQLTSPVKVDYQALLEATSEHQELTRKKIDPTSAKGIELLAKARDRVRDACEAVRQAGNYCSVWKDIERRDGTQISDVTDLVKKSL